MVLGKKELSHSIEKRGAKFIAHIPANHNHVHSWKIGKGLSGGYAFECTSMEFSQWRLMYLVRNGAYYTKPCPLLGYSKRCYAVVDGRLTRKCLSGRLIRTSKLDLPRYEYARTFYGVINWLFRCSKSAPVYSLISVLWNILNIFAWSRSNWIILT